jgi:hypothetical protein
VASTHPNIPVLDLAGTPGQVGAAHGESQRDAMVQVPADGVMHVTSGCACEGGYHAVTLA